MQKIFPHLHEVSWIGIITDISAEFDPKKSCIVQECMMCGWRRNVAAKEEKVEITPQLQGNVQEV
jgi:hypothetical protein